MSARNIIERSLAIARCAATAATLRDTVNCGLLGLALQGRDEGTSRFPDWLPAQLAVKPRRLCGLSVRLDPRDWSQTIIYREVFVDSAYDLSRVRFAPTHILDCGAHIGLFSLIASAAFPDASLTAYEPNPVNFRWLEANRSGNRLGWDCRLAAVGAVRGQARLDVANSHSARLSPDTGLVTEVHRLAEVIAALDGERLILKLDIEGEERSLWPEILPRLPEQTAIFFETHHGADGWDSAAAELKRHGFDVTRTRERGRFSDGVALRCSR